MKVLVVVHGFPPEAQGGTELYALAHARTLRLAYGDEVAVLTRARDSERPEYDVRTETRDGLRIFSVNNTFRHARSFEETYRNDAIGAVADRVIDEFRPHVAHVHHLTCLSTTIVRSLADRRVPCFLTLHDYWLICHRGQLLDVNHRVCEGPGGEDEGCHACLGLAGGAGLAGFAAARTVRTIERRLSEPAAHELRRAAEWVATMAGGAAAGNEQERQRIAHMREVCHQVTQFIAPSRFIRDQFVRFGVPEDRIAVSPYGVGKTPARSGFSRTVASKSPVASGFSRTVAAPALPDSTQDRPVRLGFLGTLMASKGVHVLLEATARLLPGSVSVDVFGAYADYHGDDSYRGKIEPLLGRPDVRVRGPIAHDDVLATLKSIDVLVVPSIWPENSPFVIHEAFLAGVPVVASRIGGIPELVRDGENGLLFTAGDPDDLARVLSRLLQEPHLRGTLCEGIRPPTAIDEDVRFARDMYCRHERPNVNVMGANRMAAVVLNFRTPDQTFLAVKSLLASRRRLDDIIVVDNDRDDAIDGARGALKDVWSEITFVRTGTNLGFSAGMNLGIREALNRGAARVVLVNSDVIVPPDTIQRLERCLDSKPRLGIVGPTILARSDPGTIASIGMSYSSLTGRMRHRHNGRRLALQGRPAGALRVDGVSGCLMMVKREVFESIGLLEEEYFFSFEDLDFCLRARRAGYQTVVAGMATVYHEGAQSLGPRSPRRFYFAARNHLLLARRNDPSGRRVAALGRACSIVALNLAHAVVSPGGSLATRIGAVARGTRDYLMNRFGAGATIADR